ncbi:hypothetical protein [Spirosoma fluviale]|nr:hypothetical protein [Spirosoma fluviale]
MPAILAGSPNTPVYATTQNDNQPHPIHDYTNHHPKEHLHPYTTNSTPSK